MFRRHAGTGRLNFVEAHKTGVDGLTGLNGASSVAISPDGRHAYVTAPRDDILSIFSRNAVTGSLTFVANQLTLNGVCWVVVSSDGRHVYVVGFAESAVALFNRDAQTGSLSLVEVHRDGVDGVDGLFAASWATLSPDGRHVYVSGAEDDAIAVFSRDASSGGLTFVEMHRDGISGVEGLEGAHASVVSPDGVSVYVTGTYDEALVVFSRDATTGRLVYVETHKDGVDGVEGLSGARSIVASPEGRFLYIAGFFGNAVSIFRSDAELPPASTVTVAPIPTRPPRETPVRPVGGYGEVLLVSMLIKPAIALGAVGAMLVASMRFLGRYLSRIPWRESI